MTNSLFSAFPLFILRCNSCILSLLNISGLGNNMIDTISIEEFYKSHTELRTPEKIYTNKELGHFNVFYREMFCGKPVSYSRRDFYKITLLIGNGKMYYADKAIDIDSNALLFSNPNIPYSCGHPVTKLFFVAIIFC